jgi:hypothetical protein
VGTVTDRAGGPVEGVTLESGAGSKSESDKNGKYSLAIRPGKNAITASKDGTVLKFEVDVLVGQTFTRNIVFEPPVVKSNAATGMGIMGAAILAGLLLIVVGALARRKALARVGRDSHTAGGPAPPSTPPDSGSAPPPRPP